ncbi:MAG TPA: hypothetical protein PLP14_02070 [Chitinophagaceae bacterium]|nr:hypothetical protein [Chitinophagaceae bacterium]
MTLRTLIIVATFLWAGLLACSSSSEPKTAATSTEENNENCTPVKDPNHPKPMALMMRQMADHCDSIRAHIRQGETVDSMRFPLMPFWTAEPTDSSVLEPLFYNNAKIIEGAWRTLMSSKEHQREHYTAVINACIHCHSSYCAGPLKRIRKLTMDYTP